HFPYNMVKGDWLKVHLSTPFTYSFSPQGESGKIPNLVVHVSQDSMTFFTPSSLAPALYAYLGGESVVIAPVWDKCVCGSASLLWIGFDVQPLAGVSDLTSVRGFTLVPNPAATAALVRFEATEALSQSELTITNIAGMVVKRVPLGRVNGLFTQQIDVSGLANGLYFVTLHANGQQQVQKLVVQR
ncbi:MAG: T9SS type A sorting domain-containing protein, partial [Bacteroidetes bacterium]|nr:T9SS type A sorting domain-containing protein [Bacteroidota bacterium]